MEINTETLEFIQRHLGCDPVALRLRYGGKAVGNVDISVALTQIEARNKARVKLKPWLEAHPDFMFPDTLSAEQCTAWQVAAYHARVAGCPDSVLDLTCGLGVDAMTIAGQAGGVITCDTSYEHVQCANANARILGLKSFKAVHCDAYDFLQQLPAGARFSLIFADPARRGAHSRRTYALEDCSPDIMQLMPLIKARAARLIVKVSPMLDVTRVIEQINSVTALYAISLKGECKELLLDCDLVNPSGRVRCVAVDISASGLAGEFEFFMDRNSGKAIVPVPDGSAPCINSPEQVRPGMWLFEPNASLMKFINVAPIGPLCPGMRKLSANTHLWVSDAPMPSRMPGRVLFINDVLTAGKRTAACLPCHINIVTRNFPDSAEKVKKQLKVKDGGEDYLYCCRIGDRQARMLHCVLPPGRERPA